MYRGLDQLLRGAALFLLAMVLTNSAPAQAAAGAKAPPQTVTNPGGSVAPQFDTAGAAQLVDLINQARANEGLKPLTVDPRLTQAAQKHTQLMAERANLEHQLAGEPTMLQRFANEGLPWAQAGENVAFNTTVALAHEGLMGSPPHRQNILDPDYNVVGVGIVHRGQNIYVTEDFAQRLPEYSEPEAEAVVQAAINRYARSARMIPPTRQAEPKLRSLACGMALNDKLNQEAIGLPGVHEAFAWTAGDPGELPNQVAQRIAQGLPSGYALGACFAPSVSHPGGVYWLVMVTY